MQKTLTFIFILFLFSINTNTYCESQDPQQDIQGIAPYQWNELIFHRNSSDVWGSTNHDYILKSKKIHSDKAGESCSKEFNFQLSLYKLLQAHDPNNSLRTRATFVEPRNFMVSEDSRKYYFTMERLYPIKKGKFKPLQRMYLGCRNNNHNITEPKPFAELTPNNYLSYQEVEDIVSLYPRVSEQRTNIEQLCYDLGTLLALIHLDAKKDGYNMEVSLVKRSKDTNHYKMVVLDFDLVEDVESVFAEENENSIVDTLLLPMKKEYYFPFPTTKGFKHFREGYFTFAAELDRKNKSNFYLPIAQKLFKGYIACWLKKKLLNLYAIEKLQDQTALELSDISIQLLKEENIQIIQSIIEKNDYYIQEEQIFASLKNTEQKGMVILMYGPPCAGKSTLSKKLTETLPGNFKVIKRASMTFKLCQDYVESQTGVRPKTHYELSEMEELLPNKIQKNFRDHFKEKAIEPTIKQIQKSCLSGDNIIFDICLYQPHEIDSLENLHPVHVLVYCSLKELSKREKERSLKKNLSIKKRRFLQKNILAGYCDLFQPGEQVEIIPKVNPDILIDSSRYTVDESAEIIRKYLQHGSSW